MFDVLLNVFWIVSSLFQVVTAHGICHLLGYRHETEEEWTEVCLLNFEVQHTMKGPNMEIWDADSQYNFPFCVSIQIFMIYVNLYPIKSTPSLHPPL